MLEEAAGAAATAARRALGPYATEEECLGRARHKTLDTSDGLASNARIEDWQLC
jgi:hypothetical protein